MVSRPPLGRGLASLLPTAAQNSALKDLSTDQIHPDPNQPRRAFDNATLEDLAKSIARHGVIQPLIVRKERDKYILVAGERRWRAAQIAKTPRVPVVIRESTGSSPFELALVENLQREDLNPIDEALAYQHLRDAKETSASQIASTIGKSRSHVANMMRLLDLPAEAVKAIGSGEISPGHGRAILMTPATADRGAFFSQLMKERWSVRRAEKEARALAGRIKPKPHEANPLGPYFKTVEMNISTSLGLETRIRARKNQGVLEIPFANIEDLKKIAATLMNEGASRDRKKPQE